MNQRQLASVLFVVIGVFLAITWIPQLFFQIAFLWKVPADAADAYGRVVSVTYLIGSGLGLVLAVGLILVREALSRRLFPADGQALTAPELQAVALSVLGVYFVIVGACRFIAGREIEWSAIVQFVFGLGLFVGARAIARFWSFARNVGINAGDRAV